MRYYRASVGILLGLITLVLYTNCSGIEPGSLGSLNTGSSVIEGFECEEQLAVQGEVPSTIDEMTEYINSLPKPLSVPCLVASFKGPLSIHATTSPLSAQPSIRPESPRIFIVKNNLMISITPEGTGKDMVEFGEVTSPMMSLKGELRFPVEEELSPGAPYDTIKDPLVPGTNCRFCHQAETRVFNVGAGEAYVSNLTPAPPGHRIPAGSLRNLALQCNGDAEPFRCAMLRYLMLNRTVSDVELPTDPI